MSWTYMIALGLICWLALGVVCLLILQRIALREADARDVPE